MKPELECLTDSEVASLVRAVARSHSWDDDTVRLAVVDRRRTRTSHLYRCQGDNLDLVVKVFLRADDDPQVRYESLRCLRDRAFNTYDDVDVPDALGWSRDPPALVMQYIQGVDASAELLAAIGAVGRPQPGTKHTLPSEVMARAGDILGSIHNSFPAPGDSPSEDGPTRLARRVLAAPMVLDPSSRCIRVGDFRLQNLRRSPDGRWWLLDPPLLDSWGPAYADIAWFFCSLHRLLMREGNRRIDRVETLLGRLREPFLEAYRSAGPVDPTVASARSAIATYECESFLIRGLRHIRRGELGPGLEALSCARRRRPSMRRNSK